MGVPSGHIFGLIPNIQSSNFCFGSFAFLVLHRRIELLYVALCEIGAEAKKDKGIK